MNHQQTEKILKVIIGLVFDDRQRIVIAQRQASSSYPGYWEFPGGKQDPNETPKQALMRELWEEIGIKVNQAHPFLQTTSRQADQAVELNVWQVTNYDYSPYGREGQYVQHVSIQYLDLFEFPEGNAPIIKKIREQHCSSINDCS